ncbi:hypothetical protein PG990_013783 [Apiospora arundinis]
MHFLKVSSLPYNCHGGSGDILLGSYQLDIGNSHSDHRYGDIRDMRNQILLLLKIVLLFTAISKGSAVENAYNTVTLIHPKPGENLRINAQYRVEWKLLQACDSNVSIKLMANARAQTIASKIAIQNLAYDWKVNDTLKPKGGYYMYLEDEGTGDRLNILEPFTIVAADGSGSSSSQDLSSSYSPPPTVILPTAILKPMSSDSGPESSRATTTQPPPPLTSAKPRASTERGPTTTEVPSTDNMSSLWSSSYVSTSYSSELVTPEPPPASPEESSSPNNEATKAPPIVAIVAGITACTVIGLNVGWLVIRHRRRRSQEEEGKYKDKDGNTALTGSDRQPDRGCLSYSKPQLEDTGIVELEADLAPPGATGKPGVCYELEAIEKPTELRTSVATWLSRRTERSRRGVVAHSAMS